MLGGRVELSGISMTCFCSTLIVREQAQDVLVPLLLRNCLTLNDTFFPVISSPPVLWSLQFVNNTKNVS